MWVVSRLKRISSASIDQKPARKALRGVANNVATLVPSPFERVRVMTHRERHFRSHAAQAELAEELQQMRIRAVVEDKEAGVDRVRHAVERHVHGVRVSAWPRVGFE